MHFLLNVYKTETKVDRDKNLIKNNVTGHKFENQWNGEW